jgi:hypothetical protein
MTRYTKQQKNLGRPLIILYLMVFYLGLTEIAAKTNKNIGLRIENPATEFTYISHNGKPLLAFGCFLEHMFFTDEDYEHWANWAAEHGMNHCRTRLFKAPIRAGNNDLPPDYSPFKKMENGKYDLTQWDETYWKRFHKICSTMQSKAIIIHLLIFPQCTGGHWENSAWVYFPDNNVNPETEYLRSPTTATFWQTLSKGKLKCYQTQMAILDKLVQESVNYDNIYYDLCHEPFFFHLSEQERKDAFEFIKKTTKRFFSKYQELRPDKTPLLGMDTDWTPPGKTRDWIFNHDRFNILIKGQNHEGFYTNTIRSIELRKTFKKPFCPQECCDWPGLPHIPDCGHPHNLSYYWPNSRIHIRKYVWRWMMAKTQLIDIYHKRMGSTARVYENVSDSNPEKQRMIGLEQEKKYDPKGHNPFEDDALILREFWNSLIDYPNLDFNGDIVKGNMGSSPIRRVLSSSKEAIIYVSQEVGRTGKIFKTASLKVINLALKNGTYMVEIWKPAAPGGIIKTIQTTIEEGILDIGKLPQFTDDIAIHVIKL